MLNNLAFAIKHNLHHLTTVESINIIKTTFTGEHNIVATVTREDFEAVAGGNSLEDILSCDGDMDWVAYRLSERCAVK